MTGDNIHVRFTHARRCFRLACDEKGCRITYGDRQDRPASNASSPFVVLADEGKQKGERDDDL